MMNKKIVITGLGIYSPIGKNVNEVYNSIVESKSGIKKIEELDVSGLRNDKGGVVKDIDEINTLNGLRANLLLKNAVNEAVLASRLLEIPLKDRKKISVSVGTSVGGYGGFVDHLYNRYGYSKNVNLNPNSTLNQDNGEIIRNIPFSLLSYEVANEYCLRGPISSSITACSASANSIVMAADMIKCNRANAVVVCGVDPITPLTLLGFNSLMAMTKSELKTMDENRSGLLIGEGAGCLIIEDEEFALKRNAPIFATLSGCGISNDAFHATRPHPNACGAILAISKALSEANLVPGDIDYINLHGTGTKHNDVMELIALEAIWGDNISVPVSSSKSMMGHTLGAAGAIEAVISIISLVNNLLPPNLNVTEKIKAFNYNLVQKTKKVNEVKHVLSNSFGFGGNCASLIFSKY